MRAGASPASRVRFNADPAYGRTVFKRHTITLGDNAIAPFVSNLSPFGAKRGADPRLFDIPDVIASEPVPEVGRRGRCRSSGSATCGSPIPA